MFGAECRAFGRLCICAPRARVSPEISRFTRRRAADDGINGMMAAAYCSYIARDQPAAQTWDTFRETCDLRALLSLSLCSNFTTGRERELFLESAKILLNNTVRKKTQNVEKHDVQSAGDVEEEEEGVPLNEASYGVLISAALPQI